MRALLVCAAVVGWSGAAWAQDKAAADTLFDEGRTLAAAGKVAEACAKFEASIAVMPQLGVRLNLGDCFEKLGRTASAWSAFRGAESQALKAGDPRAAFATQRVKALEPKLSRLAIKVAAPVPGLLVRRDGGSVPAALYGTAVPVDPGPREVVASAEGYEEWKHTVEIKPEPTTTTVEVPELKKLPEDVVIKPAGPVDQGGDPGKGRRVIGLVVGGAGLVMVGVGVVFGLGAKSAWSDAMDLGCDDDGVCPTQQGLDRSDSARSKATIGTILGIGEIAALGTGVVIYLTAPKRRERAVTLAPLVGGDVVGLTVRGGF